jgi:hypothetical protein
METCFNKFESQTSFGSMYKTRIEGYQMFCDFYNPQTGTVITTSVVDPDPVGSPSFCRIRIRIKGLPIPTRNWNPDPYPFQSSVKLNYTFILKV